MCVDGGSDINIIPKALFMELLGERVSMKVTIYTKPRKFALAASDQYVSCDREIVLDTEIYIRHGKALLIRNLKWLVATERVDEAL